MSVDPLLDARIQTLDDNLRRLEVSVALSKRLYANSWRRTDLWVKLGDAVEQGVKDCDDKLERARARLAPPPDAPPEEKDPSPSEAWRLYAEAKTRSEPLFRGCLEFIGGVAFRRPGYFDEKQDREAIAENVWLVADQLMHDAAQDSFAAKWDFLTVPAVEDALSESLTRTVRLRFPEWSVWTLPLLAYDLGLVAIQHRAVLDKRLLRDVVRMQGARFAAQDEELKRRIVDTPEAADVMERAATARWENHVRVLLADAFATFTMGPAYACASLYLRFDAPAAFSGNPSYNERAETVLWALDKLDQPPPSNRRRAPFIERLREAWRSAAESAEPRGAPGRQGVDGVLHEAFADALDRSIPSAGRYSPASWAGAEKIELDWLDEIANRRELTTALEAQKLRDVLNAAWLCRIDDAASTGAVAGAALAACLKLIERQDEEAGTRDHGRDRRDARVTAREVRR